MSKYYLRLLFIALGLLSVTAAKAQQEARTLNDSATLQQCVDYALKHNPMLKQSFLDAAITESQVKSKLADWYPQIGLTANYQRNFQLQTFANAAGVTRVGRYNQSALQLGLTQNIFNSEVQLASRTADDVRLQAQQQVALSNIDIQSSVSKAFYNVLLTEYQLQVLDEDINRLRLSLDMAKHQYDAGIVDKVDYSRATISLNTSVTLKANAVVLLQAKYAKLKELMGYPTNAALSLTAGAINLEQEALIDTLVGIAPEKRVEFQQLLTTQNLNKANIQYRKNALLPTVSLFANYNVNFLNDELLPLYNQGYPNSFAGLQVGFPIFQGGKRRNNIKQAEFQFEKSNWAIEQAKNVINTEYENALSLYKSDWNTYQTLKENLGLSKEVYRILDAQYKAGVKNYLEVVVAQTDLQKAEINYANAIYQLLIDKVDIQKALGDIQTK
ncbi:transporter [Taibaiella sp. KBW10]|uniref:TolC family protein n=1 Tax=Taibaiella sp. KBW10 TaxID=2153357 RepID=UPI000F5999CF|nr:TolC family protein [Taibaiella sp. KBW10]RQO31665.1 transporter [Taibaiella sp. KBW10]